MKAGREGPRRGLADRWTAFWFAPGDPRNLAAARIIVASQAGWVLLSRDLPLVSAIPPAFWNGSRRELAMRYLLFQGHPGIERVAEVVALAALGAVAAGVLVRIAAPLAALLLYHLAPLQALIATRDPINRGLTIAVLCLVVLGASRCADAWSLRRQGEGAAAEAWEYGWPLRLMWVFVAQIYLFGFAGKLRESGIGWFTAENVRRNLTLYAHMHPGVPDPLLAAIVARPWLPWLAAGSVFVLEGAFIASVFSRHARRVIVPVALAFHFAILRGMRIVFANVAHLGLFVNWGACVDRIRGTSATRGIT